jgi:hypothetical protein
MKRVGAISRTLATISCTIVGHSKNLASPNNDGHMQEGIMPSRILAAILGRVLMNSPLKKSSRHCVHIR